MSVRAGVGLVVRDAGVDAFAEAAARAALGLGGAPCGLALVFAGGAGAAELDEGARVVRERLRPRAMIGCGAQGVVASGREVEDGGVTVWAASLGEGHAEPFRLEASPAGRGIALSGVPNLDDADAVLLLVDPYGFPVEPLLNYLNEARPGVPVLGGLASAGPGAALVQDEDVRAGGAVGAVLRGVRVVPCVSQGARPVGPEMVITAGEGNVIHELASRPALDRVRDAVGELHPGEQALAAAGLLLGVVVDPNKPDYERGDFLIRGIVGADEETGSLSVGTSVRVGQTVQLQVRDAASAHDDLVEELDRRVDALGAPPAGALMFTCNGRGQGMFGVPDHDAGAVSEALGGAPSAGFFCAGEIGPVGQSSFVHGFTATLALFPA